jgi:hypothetical protein
VATARRQQAVVTRYGCRRGEFFEGCKRRGNGDSTPSTAKLFREWKRTVGAGNRKPGELQDRKRGATDPRTRSVEKAVEVGKNHEDGT